MDFIKVKKELKELGISLWDRDDEYRVNFTGGREATAYYTTDLSDARDTGIAMSKEGRK